MSEMVEKVARAIRDEADKGDALVSLSEAFDLARAAIEALREPTKGMIEKAGLHDLALKELWEDMIDAALA